jgi:hypothetical protein
MFFQFNFGKKASEAVGNRALGRDKKVMVEQKKQN